jgi:hypothetical protein
MNWTIFGPAMLILVGAGLLIRGAMPNSFNDAKFDPASGWKCISPDRKLIMIIP